eukprot:4251110-Amphidinium_carterae.1
MQGSLPTVHGTSTNTAASTQKKPLTAMPLPRVQLQSPTLYCTSTLVEHSQSHSWTGSSLRLG